MGSMFRQWLSSLHLDFYYSTAAHGHNHVFLAATCINPVRYACIRPVPTIIDSYFTAKLSYRLATFLDQGVT